MRRLLIPLLATAAFMASCASSYQGRITSRLVDIGLSRPMARCMAERMVDRLSTSQLRSIARFGSGLNHRGDMTIGELTRRFSQVGDPQVVDVVARAGIACAIAA